MTILWVDDDIETGVMKAYVDEFRDNNIEVITIDNPDQFLKTFEYIKHDILIMDVMMPIGDKLNKESTNSGYSTGLELIKNTEKKIKNNSVIIFSILNTEKIKQYSQNSQDVEENI